MAERFPHAQRPCDECPWRLDVPTGRFPPERFAALAPSAYDQSFVIFSCHKSPEAHPFACAGFLLRGATHNLSIRFAAGEGFAWRNVEDGGHPLYASFREMAVANGVSADAAILLPCRDA